MSSVVCTVFMTCFVAMYYNGAQSFKIDSLEVLCISLVNWYDLALNRRVRQYNVPTHSHVFSLITTCAYTLHSLTPPHYRM